MFTLTWSSLVQYPQLIMTRLRNTYLIDLRSTILVKYQFILRKFCQLLQRDSRKFQRGRCFITLRGQVAKNLSDYSKLLHCKTSLSSQVMTSCVFFLFLLVSSHERGIWKYSFHQSQSAGWHSEFKPIVGSPWSRGGK